MSNKLAIPNFQTRVINHPFKVYVYIVGEQENRKPLYNLAVNYHSHLYKGLKIKDNYLDYERIKIEEFSENGLDFVKEVPKEFPGQNFYCLLEIDIKDLQATAARIQWVLSDKSQDSLAPIVFESADNLRQTKARIIIGVFVADKERTPGRDPEEAVSNKSYFIQYVYTHLIMCNMVFDGIPVIYPVPFGGGRLNFGLPE